MLYSASFVALFLANLCIVSSFGAFFLFPVYIAEHGGSEGDIGIIMGCFALASAVCRPWVSDMIDRVGRKNSYLCGCLIMTVLPLCYLPLSGELNSFYLPLLVLRIVHGVGLAICFTAIFTLAADLIPPGRLNEGIGIFGISGLLGMALGPMLAEGVLQEFGFATFFIASSLLAGFGFVLTLPLSEPYRQSAKSNGPGFFMVMFRKKQLIVALLALLFGFGIAASTNFVAPLAQERQLAFISLYYLAYSGAAVLIRFAGGRVADRVGERKVLPYALAITATGLLALLQVEGVFTFFTAGFIAGCGHGLLFPTLNTLAIRNEPPEIRGKITGIFTGGLDTGAFIGAIILGYIGEWGGLNLLFAVAGGALLAGLGLVGKIPAEKTLTP